MNSCKNAADIIGFVLAAGYGTRMRPFTEHVPKPCLPFMNVPLLHTALFQLKSAGIKSFATNAHHLGNLLEKKAKEFDPTLQIFHEEKEPLGTGGAFSHFKQKVHEKTLIVAYNGDIISDIDFNKLVAEHRSSGALATMAVLPQPLNRDRQIQVTSNLVIKDISADLSGPHKPLGFASAHVLSARFLKYLPPKHPSSIITAYLNALAKGELIKAYLHSGYWEALDTPEDFYRAHMEFFKQPILSEQRWPFPFPHRSAQALIHPSVMTSKLNIGDQVIIGEGCTIGVGATLERCVVLPGTVIKDGEVIKQMIKANYVEYKINQ